MRNENEHYGPILGAVIVTAVVAFFLGTMVVWGRPVVKKEVTETKCDKTQYQQDVEGAKDLCYNSRVVAFTYEDDGKGNKTIPVVKCKE